MSRSSPGVRRVAAILNFIADHPGQAFALTDLVRALRLSRATCHALLTGLVDVGYLYRTSDKTYVLGPALAAIGRTASAHFSPLQVAQPEMRALADAFDVVCGAYFLEGDTVHLRDRAASVSHVGYPVPLGNRHALPRTLAPIFYAGSRRDALQWFAGKPHPDEQRSQFEATLDFVAQNGFVAIVFKPGYVTSLSEGTPVLDSKAYDEPVEALSSLDLSESYRIAAVFAPIFDERGDVSFALGMAGFSEALVGSAVAEAGRRLREACNRISCFMAGRTAELADAA
jgi:DNA-binding IclR family transcriptional regulator